MNFDEKINILWVDDEIELLKPHIIFLEKRGYKIVTANNGLAGLDLIKKQHFDLVFLDENMPGLGGLEVLIKIKNIKFNIPIIMITKNEEESIMEEAIGSKISDYLIKPVNPNQILLCIKKHIDKEKLVSKKTTLSYQQEFRKISLELSGNLNRIQWEDIFKKLVFWELELESSGDSNMKQILEMQKSEANAQFSKFIKKEYRDWLHGKGDSPVMSHTLFRESIYPQIDKEKTNFLILIDNLRFDQWKILEPELLSQFRVQNENLYFSILPTATQYSRNAIFSGLMPSEMEKLFPNLWKNDNYDGGRNIYEKEFFEAQLKRLGIIDLKISYNKITNIDSGRKLSENMQNLMHNDLNIIVYNFVDMLSHSRTDMQVIKELAEDDSAYRSLTASWFEHSPLRDIFHFISEKKSKVFVTTDHGTILVKKPIKVLGDKEITNNLRYKQGKNMRYDSKDVYEINNPRDVFLPNVNLSSKYIFALEDSFFAYPNNYNYFVNHYKETFQHGGISLEEMIIPFVTLIPKN